MRSKRPSRRTPSGPFSLLICLVLAGVGLHAAAAFGTTVRPASASRRPLVSPPIPQRQQQLAPSSIRNAAATLNPPLLRSSVASDAESSDDSHRTPGPLTALRATLRAATGFSLTAFRASIRAATGISLSQTISGILRRVLGVLSPGMRYFLQPLLIMYYAPMLLVKYWMVGPSQQYVEESLKGHEKMVEGWRKAVEAAEKANAGGYWPVHVNDDGTITTSLPPDPSDVLDLADGIEKSVAATTTATTSMEELAP